MLGWLLCLAVAQAATAQDLITAVGGTLTTNYENYNYKNGGSTSEWSGNLVDNNISTKFFIFYPNDYTTFPILAQYKFNTASIAAQYTLTSANDSDPRDPKNWTMEGSNDGSTWTTIDTRTNETFPSRAQTKVYDIASPASYLYYRLNISAISGTNTHFQLAEWRLFSAMPPTAAPSSLSGFATGGAEIALTWIDNSINESSFAIERSPDGINYTPLASVPANTTSYTDNAGLLINTTYYYRVKAVNNTGSSAYVSTNVKTLNQPGAIADVTDDGGTLTVLVENTGGASANEGSAKLIDNNYGTKYLAFGSVPAGGFWIQYKAKNTWVATGYTITSANDASGRDIKTWQFQGSNDGSTWSVLDTRTGVLFPKRSTQYKFTFANTAAFTYYRLLVTANNGATDGVMTQIGEWEIWGMNTAAPAVPTSLAVTNTGYNNVTLTWVDNATNESGFQIERSEDGVVYSAVGTVAANVTTYTDQNLYGGTLYYYRVRATSTANGVSVPSNAVSTTTLWDPNLPLSPRNLVANGTTASDIVLTWEDKSANESGFRIERSPDGVAFSQIGTVGANVVTYTSSGLVKATKYYYRVIAYNANGTSYYSNIASAITQGINTAPTFGTVKDTTVCSRAFAYNILITGINPGASESYQKVVMSAVSSNANLFATLSFSAVSNDSATLTFQAKGDVKDSATITVTATDDGGTYNGGANSFTRTFKIVFNPLTIAIASLEGTSIPQYQSAHLTAYGDRVTKYLWSDTAGIISATRTTAQLVVKPTYHTLYTVTGSNAEGCSVSASISIGLGTSNVMPTVVNVLTPNGDGKNDKWIVWNINRYPDNSVQVFDRAGRVLFYKKNYYNDWDGTYNGHKLAEGTYLYVVTLGPGIEPLKGVLTIIYDHK
ncbi:MAG: gliding motility-associated C-terminal domain-containing protein [Bacteroidetes bacterium]|nr:gliding motility-associated C-terminal domain-containing protein [Bacteroidota bacterium]